MSLTAKGEARRQLLLEAVLRVSEREGSSSVTHRSVAQEAKLPVAAVSYYFDSVDDLLVSALTWATQQQVLHFALLSGHTVTELAQAIFDYTHNHRAAAIAQYELLFLAMRRDSLRPAAELWYRALDEAVDALAPEVKRRATAALAIDGLLLQMLWRGEPDSVAATEAELRKILETT